MIVLVSPFKGGLKIKRNKPFKAAFQFNVLNRIEIFEYIDQVASFLL